jgi:geranylgeranyl diphosphate synthase type I
MTIDAHLVAIEARLREALAAREGLPDYYGMMQYHMGWLDEQLNSSQVPRGKRLRPLLCLLACEAVGGRPERALPAAASVELVHNFSLIHDDIEDGSATRRHRATVWAVWGLAHGVNCGDGMFARAVLELGRLPERGVSPEQTLTSQRVLLETCVALTEGQYLDITFETQTEVDLDSYLRMIHHKSAALIACSTQLGALVGGASEEVVAHYAQFGEHLGMAFQVIDDILGIWGTEGQTGKSTSSDILNRKKTLPVVYALSDKELRAIYAREKLTERDVARVLAILERKGARAFAEQVAGDYSARAMRSLVEAGQDSPARQALQDLALSLLKRSS